MPCYKPVQGFRSREVNLATGKRSVVFNARFGYPDMPVTVPCGQCVGCRLMRSREWAVRCIHEAQLHSDNCFITLTYADEHLPEGRSLQLEHYQKFMKRLRKANGPAIRFFHCGEYGSRYGRPHYHALLFNYDFRDKKLFDLRRKKTAEVPLFVSEHLQELWPFGFSTIGAVTFESAAYVARYIMKKVTGELADDHYDWCDPETGEVFRRAPEYTTMSRRPGIGRGWLEKYGAEVWNSDFVVIGGRRLKVPRYYDKVLELEDLASLDELKRARRIAARSQAANNTPARLEVREKVQLAKLKQLKRDLD